MKSDINDERTVYIFFPVSKILPFPIDPHFSFPLLLILFRNCHGILRLKKKVLFCGLIFFFTVSSNGQDSKKVDGCFLETVG